MDSWPPPLELGPLHLHLEIRLIHHFLYYDLINALPKHRAQSSVSAESDAERILSGSPDRAGKFDRLMVRSSSINIPELLCISLIDRCVDFGAVEDGDERSSSEATFLTSIPFHIINSQLHCYIIG